MINSDYIFGRVINTDPDRIALPNQSLFSLTALTTDIPLLNVCCDSAYQLRFLWILYLNGNEVLLLLVFM